MSEQLRDSEASQDTRDADDRHTAADDTADAPEELSFWTIVVSTLAAAIGVQSSANKERDFRSGRVAPFIVAGILFTVLFVVTLVAIVALVLPD